MSLLSVIFCFFFSLDASCVKPKAKAAPKPKPPAPSMIVNGFPIIGCDISLSSGQVLSSGNAYFATGAEAHEYAVACGGVSTINFAIHDLVADNRLLSSRQRRLGRAAATMRSVSSVSAAEQSASSIQPVPLDAVEEGDEESVVVDEAILPAEAVSPSEVLKKIRKRTAAWLAKAKGAGRLYSSELELMGYASVASAKQLARHLGLRFYQSTNGWSLRDEEPSPDRLPNPKAETGGAGAPQYFTNVAQSSSAFFAPSQHHPQHSHGGNGNHSSFGFGMPSGPLLDHSVGGEAQHHVGGWAATHASGYAQHQASSGSLDQVFGGGAGGLAAAGGGAQHHVGGLAATCAPGCGLAVPDASAYAQHQVYSGSSDQIVGGGAQQHVGGQAATGASGSAMHQAFSGLPDQTAVGGAQQHVGGLAATGASRYAQHQAFSENSLSPVKRLRRAQFGE